MGIPRSLDNDAAVSNSTRRALLEQCLEALNGLDKGGLEQAQRLLGDLVAPEPREASAEPRTLHCPEAVVPHLFGALVAPGLRVPFQQLSAADVRTSSPKPECRGSSASSADSESSLSEREWEQQPEPSRLSERECEQQPKPATTCEVENKSCPSERERGQRKPAITCEVGTKSRKVGTPALKVLRAVADTPGWPRTCLKPSVECASLAADSPVSERLPGFSIIPAVAERPVAPAAKLPPPEAEECCFSGYKVFPEVQRGVHPGLPSLSRLPARMLHKLEREMRVCKPRARLFVLCCADGGFPSWFIHFATTAPSWCDVVFYEMPGQATRSEEVLPETVDELFEDCWECLQPAFEQMAKGGAAEGCPFAFRCSSAGTLLATKLAARVLDLYGLEPCCAIFTSATPPSRPFLTRAGRALMRENPSEFLERYMPKMAAGKHRNCPLTVKFGNMFVHLLDLTDAYIGGVDHIFHTFSCPLHIFVETKGYSSEFEPRTLWDFEQWKHWTTGPCEVSMVDCHLYDTSIKFHPDVTTKLWAEFGKHVRAA